MPAQIIDVVHKPCEILSSKPLEKGGVALIEINHELYNLFIWEDKNPDGQLVFPEDVPEYLARKIYEMTV